jgi:hypothetical protein
MDPKDIRNLQEAYLEVYDNIMEKEDSPYEKASDAALDRTYGYGRASGDKRSFGRAANRASAAAMLRRLRRDRDEGRTTSRESGADAVHQGWAHTARTSSDQTPEKKKRRAKLADTPYSQLPNDEQEKDRVSADAVRALYNRNNTQKEQVDLYDIILSHLIDEGYADTIENAESIMVNMSEDWRQSIVEGPVGEFADRVASTAGSVVGTVQRAAREVPKYVDQKIKNVAGTYENSRQKSEAKPTLVKPRSTEFSHGNQGTSAKNPGPNFGRG